MNTTITMLDAHICTLDLPGGCLPLIRHTNSFLSIYSLSSQCVGKLDEPIGL